MILPAVNDWIVRATQQRRILTIEYGQISGLNVHSLSVNLVEI